MLVLHTYFNKTLEDWLGGTPYINGKSLNVFVPSLIIYLIKYCKVRNLKEHKMPVLYEC